MLYMLLFSLMCFHAVASAFADSEEEIETLRMYYKEEDIALVSATRFPKLKSQTAENITIITAKEIEEMNAHTLADVMSNITGIQGDAYTGIGTPLYTYIQGSNFYHVPVIIDGVRINNLTDNYPDIGSIPAQIIERVEIIKGPASSSWGSSLGGIINVITKSGGMRELGGAIAASQGEMNTGDFRLEASGRAGDFSYYLYGGNLKSNGYSQGYSFYENNIYTKLNYDMTDKLSLTFTARYSKMQRGLGEFPVYDEIDTNKATYIFSTLSADYSISDTANLKLSLRTFSNKSSITADAQSTGAEYYTNKLDETGNGGSAVFSFKKGIHTVVIGSDFDDGTEKSNVYLVDKIKVERYAFFANDTIAFGKFTLTPGVRWDHISTVRQDFISPSLGVTYNITDRTLLRLFAARGFNAPSLGATSGITSYFHPNPDLAFEKIWSVHAGIETTAIKYLHLKASLFMHRINDAIDYLYFDDGTWTLVNKGHQKREGFEIEIKTVPVYNTSVFAGIYYNNAKDTNTDQTIAGIAGSTYDVGLQYDNKKSFKALMKGHYIWWNGWLNGQYNSFIWDINLAKKVYTKEKQSMELFLAGHNIFKGSQYSNYFFKNPGRWLEAGIRYKF